MISSASISSSWLYGLGLRLDASFYLESGRENVRRFLHSKTKRIELHKLTKGGRNGIYIPPRFKRIYVASARRGLPYLTGSGIVELDPFNSCRYLSRKYTKQIAALALSPGMILVTCSGLIGNSVYVSDYLSGAIGSPDLLRIIPDKDKIPPGYIQAFLSSQLGRSLIVQNTYGSVVQHIEAHHIYDLPVPLLRRNTMIKIAELMDEAATLRCNANQSLTRQRSVISELLQNFMPNVNGVRVRRIKYRALVDWENRLDAQFYAAEGRLIYENITAGEFRTLGSISKIFFPVLFGKREMKGSIEKGIPLYKSSSMMRVVPETDYLLSAQKVAKYIKLQVNEGWILVSRAGTVGNIARLSSRWAGIFVDDNMIRISPSNGFGGLIYLFLTSEIGNNLVTFQKYGSVQDHINDFLLKRIPIPEKLFESRLCSLVEKEVKKAFDNFDKALTREDEARRTLQRELY